MATKDRDSARRGIVRAVAMVAALFGGGVGVASSDTSGGVGERTGKGPNDIAKARFRGKLRRAAWRKMHR